MAHLKRTRGSANTTLSPRDRTEVTGTQCIAFPKHPLPSTNFHHHTAVQNQPRHRGCSSAERPNTSGAATDSVAGPNVPSAAHISSARRGSGSSRRTPPAQAPRTGGAEEANDADIAQRRRRQVWRHVRITRTSSGQDVFREMAHYASQACFAWLAGCRHRR